MVPARPDTNQQMIKALRECKVAFEGLKSESPFITPLLDHRFFRKVNSNVYHQDIRWGSLHTVALFGPRNACALPVILESHQRLGTWYSWIRPTIKIIIRLFFALHTN
jgi:hypothetical protein